ncbi:hypothetical protein Tco_0678578 [Tanacetum coccineum]|uniref:Uncharacterized protein n=1 Tax=Tanacetum coccineum TaxID=301880 RepID=A0ABQ4XFG5_9ASTR
MSVAVIHRHEKNIDTAADFDGSNQLRTPSPGAYSCVDNDFERLFSTEAMKRQREWHALHSCTKCGFCKHGCRCNVRAPRWSHWDGRSEFLKIPGKKKKIYDDDALPPTKPKSVG